MTIYKKKFNLSLSFSGRLETTITNIYIIGRFEKRKRFKYSKIPGTRTDRQTPTKLPFLGRYTQLRFQETTLSIKMTTKMANSPFFRKQRPFEGHCDFTC